MKYNEWRDGKRVRGKTKWWESHPIQKERFANEDVPPKLKGEVYDIPTDGLFQSYWSNGNLRYEWEYKDGKRADGKSKGWWPNGNIKMTRNWVGGKQKGLQQEFYTNGKIWLEEMITDDKDYGEFVEYDQDGKKMNEGKFRLEYLVDGDYGASISIQPGWDDNESF
jgi:antitoxin component YwqK of YwqJK toxin-antitoxin module|tara:strand:- start:164 stop:661 length:498 start_codon:yes stop_codon:yes gene_type:complete